MANNKHTELGEQVLKTLLYFDIFNYPLKASEVLKFLRATRTSQQEVADCLNGLTEKKLVFCYGDLYSLHADDKNICRRLKGNTEAQKWLKVAEKRARLIAKFPFVRAVMASGSLSKGYMDDKSDLDFFIVTAPGRLWIARTLLVMFKRIFLRNSHKQFCVNYFVDADHLEIEEKNIFTATELATLIPLFNHRGYQDIMDSNQWITGFFPNFRSRETKSLAEQRSFLLRNLSEYLFRPVTGWLDDLFMRLSLKRWTKLYGADYTPEDFEVAFKTRRYVSKNHPNHYQKKVLERYQRKLAEFQNRFAQQTTYD